MGALEALSRAVYAALNVATLTGLVGDRIVDDVPQPPVFPFVFYELLERNNRGFGGGMLSEFELRVHVFSTYQGMREAQRIVEAVVSLLKDRALTLDAFQQCGRVFFDDVVPLADEEIAGVKCRELVARFRLYLEAV